jgi:hypothetical protein
MAVLTNHTAFAVSMFGGMDPHSRQHDVLVVSAAFVAPPGQPLRLADEPVAVLDNDVFHGDPTSSSVRYEGETAWEKPFVDVIVNGHAVAPGGRKAERLLVEVRVGDVYKELLVNGDRRWRPGGVAPGSPQPFDRMPIVYERAYGGYDTRAANPAQHKLEPRNPVGLGFQGLPPSDPAIQTEVPNVEYPDQQITSAKSRSDPAGLSVIGRHWQPRIGFAGTYDAAWTAEQFPLLPLDFDVRHFQTAPGDQQSRTLKGGDDVDIRNMTPEGRWRFSLPVLDVPVRLVYAERHGAAALRMDTVILEPDEYRLTLLARCKIPWLRSRGPLEEIILGHITPAWWYARTRGKTYLDHANRNGRMSGIKDFRIKDVHS